MIQVKKQLQRERRHRRVRAKIKGTSQCPRLCVFRSNKYIYAQLIDDQEGKTLLSVTDKKPKTKSKIKESSNINSALEVGKILAEKAIGKKIKKIVFDRGGYKYHGRVKAIAEGARQGGLKF